MALSLETSDLAETSDQEMLASTGIARLCMVLDSSADGRPGGSRSLKKHYRYHPDHSAKEGQEMSKKRKLRTMSDEEMENVDHSEWLYRDFHQGTQAADPELAERIERIRGYLLDVLGRISDRWNYDDAAGMKAVRSWAQYAYHYRQALQIAWADLRGDEVPDEHRERWQLPQESEWFQAMLEELNSPAEDESVH